MMETERLKVVSEVTVNPSGLLAGGKRICGGPLGSLYKEICGDYPKFHKMDGLCKTGFIAAEYLLKGLPAEDRENGAIVLFNRSGSLATDRNYEKTIRDGEAYFPSPALFVYTLANIVTGEIAIRHKIFGETSFYIFDRRDEDTRRQEDEILEGCMADGHPSFILTGWVEYENEENYNAELRVLKEAAVERNITSNE